MLRQVTTNVEPMSTHNKMLETYISQITQHKASKSVPQRFFPGQPDQNSRGHVNDTVTRSGKRVEISERGGVQVKISKKIS